MSDVPLIRLPPLVGRQEASWRALIELAPALGNDWLLIGGQMVFLHEVERQARDLRPTDDVDVVVDLRVDPRGLSGIHSTLTEHRFVQALPSPEEVAHRYERQSAVIDVLAPDHLGARAQLRLGQWSNDRGARHEPGVHALFARARRTRRRSDCPDPKADADRRPHRQAGRRCR